MINDEQLKGLAAQAMGFAKQDMAKGNFHMLLATYHQGENMHRMTLIERLIIERLGEDWLNVPNKKHAAFAMLRGALNHAEPVVNGHKIAKPDAFIFATAANVFVPTGKLENLIDMRKWSMSQIRQAAKDGLLETRDSITAVAQTPERVCTFTQTKEEGGTFGKPDIRVSDQKDFSGALKMYGEEETQ